ncbi:hypothetical protein [Wolbachia endosymbiont (group B) of Sphaerophoria taeniata]|uniref:hypothetical protein n=1 Tax=Wolbachia endosymbiont (group B) of Sphaerophoria taeniata TaxID=2954058 RepID=UPI002220F057|nr:hypothetical protein [Wolbachia endosymbiont (group B) of Sphaerophoria taeniata]
MQLTEEQEKLYLDLQTSIDKKEDITDLLKQVNMYNFIRVFKTNGTKIKYINEEEKTESIDLIKYAAVIDNAEALKAIFNYCKKNNILVVDVFNDQKTNVDLSSGIELCEVQFDERKMLLAILNQLKEVGVLEEFLSVNYDLPESLPTAYYESYLECLNESESEEINMGLLVNKLSDKGILKEVISIEGLKNRLKSSDNYDALEKIYRAEKEIAANKAMKFGAIGGVVTALAVGGGLFAAGVALPILAIIGIAVAAALVTGLIAGGITYAVSTKIENPDTSRSATEQGLSQPN